MNYRETIAHETLEWMKRDPKALIMGAGVADNKGIFGTTKLAAEAFPDRVIETPLSENMLTGSLLGLAQEGWHPMLVHARSDFMTLSTEHLVNSLAKWKYMGGGDLNVSIRCIIGQGWGNGPQHTQSTAHWFASVPGLDVFMPTCPADIKREYALMTKEPAVRLIYEHRRLYETSLPDQVNRDGFGYVLIVGVSASRIETDEAAYILTTKMNLHAGAMSIVRFGAKADLSTFYAYPIKPKAILFADISPAGYGILSEIALQCAEAGIKVGRISPPAVPVPASEAIESQAYPTAEQIAQTALDLIGHDGIVDDGAVDNFKPADGSPF